MAMTQRQTLARKIFCSCLSPHFTLGPQGFLQVTGDQTWHHHPERRLVMDITFSHQFPCYHSSEHTSATALSYSRVPVLQGSEFSGNSILCLSGQFLIRNDQRQKVDIFIPRTFQGNTQNNVLQSTTPSFGNPNEG